MVRHDRINRLTADVAAYAEQMTDAYRCPFLYEPKRLAVAPLTRLYSVLLRVDCCVLYRILFY